jgi:hypothetical protein
MPANSDDDALAGEIRRSVVPAAYEPSGRYIPTAGRFFEELNRSELPEAIRAPIGNVLKIFLEEDEETVAPNPASFRVFLNFLRSHRDLPMPSIGVNRNGAFVTVWQSPSYRLSYEFLPNDTVQWASTERRQGMIAVREGTSRSDALPADFACLRSTPVPPG